MTGTIEVQDHFDLGIDDGLAMHPADVARLTRPQREARVGNLVEESHAIVQDAIAEHVPAGYVVAGTVLLFSGGNDSTTLAHLFRNHATHAAHANTTIGIEETRQYVRDTCAAWHLPLLERLPAEEDTYRALVLAHGFPGPGHHWKMYQRLKERQLRQVRRELVTNPRKQRLVFLAGRRRTESTRRAAIPRSERVDSVVWVSPLVNWTKLDMNTYRLLAGDVPRNEVSDRVHMSGECLCGSFAAPGERDEVSAAYPAPFGVIADLEKTLAGPGYEHIDDYRKTWGWGADPQVLTKSREKPSKTGPLCSTCDDRFQSTFDLEVAS